MKRSSVRISFKILMLILLTQIPVLAQEEILPEDLFEMDIEELLDVDVSVASKKSESHLEAPAVVVTVPKEEFILFGDRNIHQLLQRQPSVYTRTSFAFSDNLASFRGDMSYHQEMHTLVLFNGRPIRESAQGHNFPVYMTFPLAILDSVEIVRGPGSVLYGTNAFTGVVNLKPHIPDQNEVTVSSMVGSYGYYESDVTATGKSGDFGFIGTIRTYGQQGYSYRMTDIYGVPGADNKHDRGFSGATHLEYRGFSLDFFGSDIEAFQMGVVPAWSIPDHEMRNKRLFANAGYQHRLHERMALELNITYNLQENSLSSPAVTRIGNNTSDWLGEVTLLANPTDNANIVLGYLQEYRSNYKPDSDHFQSILSYSHEPKSAYAQGDYKFGKSVKLIAGTQWNKAACGDTDLISRYGVILTPNEQWGIKLLRGEAFRAPVAMETDLNDPPISVGNKNIKPETITTYDAQLFYKDEKTYAAFTYFNSNIDKLIVYDSSVSPMSYKNGGEQKFDGVEFETKHFVTSHWQLLGSFMYQNNKADAGINPSVVPEKMAKVGAAYTWQNGSASIFYSYFGTPPQINIPGVTSVVNDKPEAINLLNMNVQMDVSKWMGFKKRRSILTLRAENILNEKVNVPTFAYAGSPNSFPYGPGTTFFAGMTIHF
jgi:outer membrane receptor protein involved in Fe transport